MTSVRNLNEPPVVSAAELALKSRFGESTTLSEPRTVDGGSSRSTVIRAQASIGAIKQPVILKAIRAPDYAPDAQGGFERFGFIKEWAARELLGQRQHHQSSRLLAGDLQNGIMIFEDHGIGLASLTERLLEGSMRGATDALVAYAIGLGRLHAETMGCAQAHAAILRGSFPGIDRSPLGQITQRLSDRLPTLGGAVLPEADVAIIRARIADPGPWSALVHGDGCPDNILMKGDDAELIDFEMTAPGHILLDAAYWR